MNNQPTHDEIPKEFKQESPAAFTRRVLGDLHRMTEKEKNETTDEERQADDDFRYAQLCDDEDWG